MMGSNDKIDGVKLRSKIISAGKLAVEQLIKIAQEDIIKPKSTGDDEDDIHLAADRLKNAAATKKLAIFDAFEILQRIEAEESLLEENEKISNSTEPSKNINKSFAESNAKGR